MEMEMLLCGGSYWWAGRDGHGGKDNRQILQATSCCHSQFALCHLW